MFAVSIESFVWPLLVGRQTLVLGARWLVQCSFARKSTGGKAPRKQLATKNPSWVAGGKSSVSRPLAKQRIHGRQRRTHFPPAFSSASPLVSSDNYSFSVIMQLLAIHAVIVSSKKPLARDLFIAYARETDPELLKKFYVAIGHPEGAAEVFLKESWGYAQNSRVGAGTPLPTQQAKLIDQAAELYSQTKEHAFEAKSAEEHIKLLKYVTSLSFCKRDQLDISQ
ncbi:unnamed protein product [Calypogeia fissa]